MNSEYMTIKEFATKAGVSTQYVYKQIRDGKLDKYLEIVDGKRYLNPEALKKIGKQKNDNQKTTNEQPIVSFLQDQLGEKDRQIAELQNSLARAQELLRTEQNIRYAVEKRLLLLEERQAAGAEEPSGEAKEAVTDDSGAITEASEDQKQNNIQRYTNPIAKTVENEHVSFWRRLWKTIRG